MKDAERTADQPDEVEAGRDEEGEKLEDLEPAKNEGGAVKGGGPRNGTAQIGGGPGD
jgi:hypothetical protein